MRVDYVYTYFPLVPQPYGYPLWASTQDSCEANGRPCSFSSCILRCPLSLSAFTVVHVLQKPRRPAATDIPVCRTERCAAPKTVDSVAEMAVGRSREREVPIPAALEPSRQTGARAP